LLNLGRVPYGDGEAGIEAAMRRFSAERNDSTEDELWLVEHEPVYTLGVAGRDAHVLDAQGVPRVRTARGGQVTYHGPGQVVAYPLVDLRRIGPAPGGIYVKEYVFRLEAAILATLADLGVTGHRVPGAPGIYVRRSDPFGHARLVLPPARPGLAPDFTGLAKIAALGIKVSQHRAYHGLALNVAMDLAPFTRIDPCGYPGLETVDLKSLGVDVDLSEVGARLSVNLLRQLQASSPGVTA
jgi:lipoyl(octanoyl) transferase